jgi:hypothetical protein
MTRQSRRQAWVRPELRKLGRIQDVAGAQGAGAQAAGVKT